MPRDRLVVITGPSGSGKSSLAFDTLYAEGQRQYIESLSPYARQFLHQLERPDVDLIEGLQPTISIDQRAGSHNPRSTVATVTEIYDYLRLLYARLGESPATSAARRSASSRRSRSWKRCSSRPDRHADDDPGPDRSRPQGRAPEVYRGHPQGRVSSARGSTARCVDVNEPPDARAAEGPHIEAVVDRVVIREGVEPRLAESIHLAVRHGDGLVLASYEDRRVAAARPSWHDELFSTLYACPDCKISYEETRAADLQLQQPLRRLPGVRGSGLAGGVRPGLGPARLGRSRLAGGAIAAWKGAPAAALRKLIDELADVAGGESTAAAGTRRWRI